MQILFLSRWFPFPPDNGSKLRVGHILRALAQRHDVTLLSFSDPSERIDGAYARKICKEVRTVPWKPFEPGSLRATTGFLASTPRSFIDTRSPEMAQKIRKAVEFRNFDVAIASQEGMAAYIDCLDGLPTLFEEVEVTVPFERFAKAQTAWKRFRYRLTWAKHRRFLGRILRRVKACTVVSDAERSLLLGAISGIPRVEVVPNCVDLQDYDNRSFRAAEPRRPDLIFTGAFSYQPNYDAMIWFLKEVFPKVRNRVPNARLFITGDHGGRPLPDAQNVVLKGRVPDVRPLIACASVSLAPILTGGGTRLKILEAMALGTPVVATSKGVEGLRAESGKDVLVADSPTEFADAAVRLLEDPGFGRILAENARVLVRERYNWNAVMPRLLELVEEVAGAGAGRGLSSTSVDRSQEWTSRSGRSESRTHAYESRVD